jgi:hypothetical protein
MKTFEVKPKFDTSKVDLSKAMAGVQQQERLQTMMPQQSRAEKQMFGAAKDLPSDFMEMGQGIKEGFQRRTERLSEDIARRSEDGTTMREGLGTGLGVAAATLGTAMDVVEEGGMFAIKSILTDEQEKAAEESFANAVGAVVEQAAGSPGAEMTKKLVAGYQKWAEENPEEAANVRDAGTIIVSLAEALGAKAGTKVAKESIDAATDAVKRTAPVVKEAGEKTAETVARGAIATTEAGRRAAQKVPDLFVPSQAKLESKIDNLFTKAVRPTVRGKETASQVEKAREQAVDAVKTINLNKDKLQFTDEIGQVTTGRAPESLREFSQSIEQTKRNIFDEYNQLAKQTGDAGVKVDPGDFVDEFDTFINDKAVQAAAPETIKYAKSMRSRYGELGDLTPEEVENVIKIYNQDLNTFYKNPTSDQGRKVAVDAMIVNNLRKQLDDAISKTTGGQYQALKNQYGALRSIEKDVLNATLRDARRNAQGLIDFTDIFTGGELAAGVISMNPALMGKAAVQKGIKSYFKWLNDPNNQVKRMFSEAETLQSRVPNTAQQ